MAHQAEGPTSPECLVLWCVLSHRFCEARVRVPSPRSRSRRREGGAAGRRSRRQNYFRALLVTAPSSADYPAVLEPVDCRLSRSQSTVEAAPC